MTFNEKEQILYMAMGLINKLEDVDDMDFVDEVASAVANGYLGVLEEMRKDLYSEEE